ncbi:hypothetical protein J2Y64_004414 [Aeromonas salmonicida]|nr:hypothetical protein [Aeromonas salmonicida]
MNIPPGKSHLTVLDILIELRCWLADNVQLQAAPATCPTVTNSPRPTVSRPLMRCCISYAISQA